MKELRVPGVEQVSRKTDVFNVYNHLAEVFMQTVYYWMPIKLFTDFVYDSSAMSFAIVYDCISPY
jgi:hypothetical protein